MNTRIFLLLISVGGLLGATTLLAKFAATGGWSPTGYFGSSGLAAALMLLAWNGRRGIPTHWNRQTMPYFVVAGILSLALPNALLLLAAPQVGAGFLSLMLALPPALTLLGGLLLRLEPLVPAQVAAIALSVTGLVVIATAKGLTLSGGDGWIALALVIPISLAAGNLYRSQRWPAGESPQALAPGLLAASAGILLVADLVFPTPLFPTSDLSAALTLLLVQSIVLAVQYALFFALQKEGGPVYLSLIGSVSALITVPVATLLLDEPVPENLGLGGTLILFGILWMTWLRRPLPSAPPPR